MTVSASSSPIVAAASPVEDPFLNTDSACNYLGVPKATLLTWRVRRPGYGPVAVKAGRRLKYRLSELDRWLGSHEETFTEEQIQAAQAIEEKPVPRPRPAVRTRARTMGSTGARSERWPDKN